MNFTSLPPPPPPKKKYFSLLFSKKEKTHRHVEQHPSDGRQEQAQDDEEAVVRGGDLSEVGGGIGGVGAGKERGGGEAEAGAGDRTPLAALALGGGAGVLIGHGVDLVEDGALFFLLKKEKGFGIGKLKVGFFLPVVLMFFLAWKSGSSNFQLRESSPPC